MERKTEYQCSNVFVTRQSPRALTADGVNKEVLLRMFEAAKWAPSSYNEQPWRFIYALNGEKGWDAILSSLVEFNQGWAKSCGALIVVCASKKFARNAKENKHASFDAGSAWMSLALQAQEMGLHTHAMAGFDPQKIVDSFSIPNSVEAIAVVAVGSKGPIESLPKEMQEQEIASGRKSVAEIAFEGEYKNLNNG